MQHACLPDASKGSSVMNNKMQSQLAQSNASKSSKSKPKPRFQKGGESKAHGSYFQVSLQEEPAVISFQFKKEGLDMDDKKINSGIEHYKALGSDHKPHSWYVSELGLREIVVNNEQEHHTGKIHGTHFNVSVWDAMHMLADEQGYKMVSLGISRTFVVIHFVHPDIVEELELKTVDLPKKDGESFLARLATGQIMPLFTKIFENIHEGSYEVEPEKEGDDPVMQTFRTSLVNFNLSQVRDPRGKVKALELKIPQD